MRGMLTAIQRPVAFAQTSAFAYASDLASPARRRYSEALGAWQHCPAAGPSIANADAKTNHLQPLGLLGGTSG